jgi:hypothetical protein
MVKNKRVYEKKIDHSHDMSYENEITYDSVNAPAHYLHGKKETIDVITDCMTNDEFHGYLKGNILKYVSRYKWKGEPLEDLQKASWYLNRLIKEVSNGSS